MYANVALKKGTILDGRIEIIKVLGIGGFGITYKAKDTTLNREVVIKEYFPADFVRRDEKDEKNLKLINEKNREAYDYGLKNFFREAKILAEFEHPNIVNIFRIFTENGTAYFEMPYEDGMDLKRYMDVISLDKITEEQILAIIKPILNGLKEVHKKKILHRDIKPGNIFLKKDNIPMLIDFGAAREAIGEKSKDLSTILTPRYAPIEQYSSDRKNQGPWTDIYSLGITAYQLIIGDKDGSKIPDANDRFFNVNRGEEDPLKMPEPDHRFSKHFLNVIEKMTKINYKDRPQSAEDVINLLEKNPLEEDKKSTSKFLLYPILILLVAGGGYFAYESTLSLDNSLIKSCNSGDIDSCKKVALDYEAEDDIRKVKEFYKKACELEDIESCRLVAEIYKSNGELTKAKEFYKKACKFGDKSSCKNNDTSIDTEDIIKYIVD